MRALVLAFLSLALLPIGCAKQETPPVEVRATKGELVAEQSFQGELVPRKTTPITVPKVPKLDVLTVKTILPDGALVKKGDVIATFDTTEVEDNLRTAETELSVAQAERAKTEHALATERITLELEVRRRQMSVEEAKLRLVEGVNLVSELDRKKAQVNLDSSEVEMGLAKSALDAFAKKRKTSLDVQDVKIKTAKTSVEDNRTALTKLTVIAPEDGVVFRPYVNLNFTRGKAEPGKVCRAGDKILELPDLTALEVVVQVRPRDAARINVGDEADVFLASDPTQGLRAKVSKKESFATTRNERYGTKTPEGNLKEISVTLELETQPPELRPGSTVRAWIRSPQAKDVVMVPLYAIDEEGEQRFVTLAGGEKRPLVLGATTAIYAEVKQGLTGDEVLWVKGRKTASTAGAAASAEPAASGSGRRGGGRRPPPGGEGAPPPGGG